MSRPCPVVALLRRKAPPNPIEHGLFEVTQVRRELVLSGGIESPSGLRKQSPSGLRK